MYHRDSVLHYISKWGRWRDGPVPVLGNNCKVCLDLAMIALAVCLLLIWEMHTGWDLFGLSGCPFHFQNNYWLRIKLEEIHMAPLFIFADWFGATYCILYTSDIYTHSMDITLWPVVWHIAETGENYSSLIKLLLDCMGHELGWERGFGWVKIQVQKWDFTWLE